MLAARLHGQGDLRVDEIPKPAAGPGEILLRVKAAAICGTDVRMYRNGARAATPATPLVLGHEVAGVVEAVGPEVPDYEPGMEVAVAPNMGCGVCDWCVGGNTQLCPSYRAVGINLPGAFAEYMVVPRAAVAQGNVARVPPGMDFVSAALVEPLSCVYNAYEATGIGPGDRVLVIGAGPIGLMHARVALMAGASQVLMNDLSQERLDLCRSREPRVTVVGSEGLRERVAELTGGRGVSVCITAAPSPEAQVLGLELVGINGRLMLFGGLPESRRKVELDTNLIHYRQIKVTGTTRQSLRQYRATLDLVAAGRLPVRDLVTTEGSLRDIPDLFDQVLSGKGLKNAIVFA